MYLDEPLFMFFNLASMFLFAMFLFVFSILEISSNKNFHGVFVIFVVWVFILVCMRTRGWDIQQYYEIYKSTDAGKLDLASWIEPGYLLISFVFKYLGAGFFAFNLFLSLLLSILIFLCIKENARYCIITLFFLFLFYFLRGPYGQVRQAIAVFTLYCSLGFLFDDKKSYAKFYLTNFLAFSIHTVSILSFFIPFFSRVIIKRKHIAASFFVFLLLSSFNGLLMPFVAHLENIPYLNKLYIYVNQFSSSGRFFNPDVARIFLCYAVVSMMPSGNSSRENLHKIVFLLGSVLYGALSFDLKMASRAASYFLMVDIFIYSNWLMYTGRNKLFYFAVLCLVGAVYVFYELAMMSAGEIRYNWSL